MDAAHTDQRLMRALGDTFAEVSDGGHVKEDLAAVVLAFTH
jgi:hypothetical protein